MRSRVIFRPQSPFFQHYLKRSVAVLLSDYGFILQENKKDLEDIVYFEKHKQFIQETIGLSDIPYNVKQEFIGEYQLSLITSVFVEGNYPRNLTGEKMYGSYSYSFYKRGFLPNGRIINERSYALKVNKVQLLKTFEDQLYLFKNDHLWKKGRRKT